MRLMRFCRAVRKASEFLHGTALFERVDVAGNEITLAARALEAADLLETTQKKNPHFSVGVRTSVTTGLRQQDSNL